MTWNGIRSAGRRSGTGRLALPLLALLWAPAGFADGGFFVGGSLGQAGLDASIGDIDFDDNDSAWKAYGGYIVDLPVVNFGVEGGYVDFGAPSDAGTTIDTTGLDVFATVGFDFTVLGVFGKAGLIAWDTDISSVVSSFGDDGTDPAYGLGLRFNVASLAVRVEYETFDIDSDDLDLYSAGVVWRF